MNERIKTSIAGSASVMRVAAIVTMVAQGLGLVMSVALAGEIGNVVGVGISIMLAVFLLQAANAQENYARGANESELLEGLKKETAYWQVTAILSLIGIIVIGLFVLAALVWGEEIMRALSRGGRF